MSAYAVQRARLLLGCYRKGDANDPETYVASIAATLSRYPEDVIRDVTHPATGLPTQKDFLPTVAEVYRECERLMRPRIEKLARERQAEKRAEDAKRFEQESADRAERPPIDDMKAKYGPNWGIDIEAGQERLASPKPIPSWDDITKHYGSNPGLIGRLLDKKATGSYYGKDNQEDAA